MTKVKVEGNEKLFLANLAANFWGFLLRRDDRKNEPARLILNYIRFK
jgi:hypothetical protein